MTVLVIGASFHRYAPAGIFTNDFERIDLSVKHNNLIIELLTKTITSLDSPTKCW